MWEVITPEATTNLITNPSFEKATTSWTQGTGWTLTRSGTHQWRGGYSGKMASSGTAVSNTLTYAFTAPAAGSYTLSCWVKDTGCNWASGTILRIAVSGALATNTYNHVYTKGTIENAHAYLKV